MAASHLVGMLVVARNQALGRSRFGKTRLIRSRWQVKKALNAKLCLRLRLAGIQAEPPCAVACAVGVAGIDFISEKGSPLGLHADRGSGCLQPPSLPFGKTEPNRQAPAIDQCIDLGCRAASGMCDTAVLIPVFGGAVCRRASDGETVRHHQLTIESL